MEKKDFDDMDKLLKEKSSVVQQKKPFNKFATRLSVLNHIWSKVQDYNLSVEGYGVDTAAKVIGKRQDFEDLKNIKQNDDVDLEDR